MKDNRSRHILDKIKQEKIVPISKTNFILKKFVYWFLVFIAILVIGHSIGVILYFVVDFDFQLFNIFMQSPSKSYLLYGLFVWTFLICIGIILFLFTYRKTPKGYRTETLTLFSIMLAASSLIGWISYKSEIAPILDQAFSKNLPYYNSWETLKINIWSQPEKGLLFGQIINIEADKIKIIDAFGNEWSVETAIAIKHAPAQLKTGEFFKFIGNILENQVFQAREIRPWRGRHKGRCRNAIDKESCVNQSPYNH